MVPFVVFALLGTILTNWGFWRSETNSPPAATGGSSTTIGHTYTTTINGPANIAQGSTGVAQTNTAAGSMPVSSTASIRGPWTDHVGLRCHRLTGFGERPVSWISTGTSAGELRPTARGGRWNVYGSAGEPLGEVNDVKRGLELIKDHES